MFSQASVCPQGRGMHGKGVCIVRGVHGRGGVHCRGHAWQGCALQGACMAGGCAWQQRRPLQRTVRILLECILVVNYFIMAILL